MCLTECQNVTIEMSVLGVEVYTTYIRQVSQCNIERSVSTGMRYVRALNSWY